MAEASLFRKRIRSGYVISFALLLASYCLLFYVHKRQVSEAGWVLHSYTVVNKSEALRAALTDAETGARGYVITKDSQFLAPYDEGLKQIPIIFDDLKSLVSDNAVQAKRIDTLDGLIERRLHILKAGLAEYVKNGYVFTGEWKLRRQEGLAVMDSMRKTISRLTGTEQQLMEGRKSKLSELYGGVKTLTIVSLVIILLALLYAVITLNMENRKREKAVQRADQYKVELESNKDVLKERDLELKAFKDTEKFTTTGRIARTIAHEVRNPLTNILLATEQLKETQRGEEATVLLELINRNASRINQLVSDLLNATRFTHLDFSAVPIDQLIEETLEMAKDRIELSRISLQRKYGSDSFDVHVDKEKMKVALLNVIVNGIEAMDGKDDGVLELNSRRHESKCIIEIRDNGKGMDGEELQKLFDPYFTTKKKGNGLGLTNTQSIILNHQGTISVFSEPGNGTLFSIQIDMVGT